MTFHTTVVPHTSYLEPHPCSHFPHPLHPPPPILPSCPTFPLSLPPTLPSLPFHFPFHLLLHVTSSSSSSSSSFSSSFSSNNNSISQANRKIYYPIDHTQMINYTPQFLVFNDVLRQQRPWTSPYAPPYPPAYGDGEFFFQQFWDWHRQRTGTTLGLPGHVVLIHGVNLHGVKPEFTQRSACPF